MAGIDEAGRGALIGPLVVAAVAVPQDSLMVLRRMGVRDSKTLSPHKRTEIYHQLSMTGAKILVRIIRPSEIDRSTKAGGGRGINALEAEAMESLLSELPPSTVYVDSPTRPQRKLASLFSRSLARRHRIVCENGADSKRTVVGAASIVAKVERDLQIAELRESYGDFGSGYPSDVKTMKFVRRHLKDLDGVLRKTWRTLGAMNNT